MSYNRERERERERERDEYVRANERVTSAAARQQQLLNPLLVMT